MSNHEIWHVMLPGGRSQSGTLEQLDEAFQNGLIDEGTLVRREGSAEWVTLAQAAGLDDDTTPQPPMDMMPSAPLSTAPVAMSTSDLADFDLDAPKLKSSKKGVIIGVAAAAVLGIAAFVAVGASATKEASSAPVVAAAAAAPPPVVADVNVAAAKTETADTQAPSRNLSDTQKKALADADKALQAEQAKKKAARQAKQQRSATSAPIKQGNPFHKGGSKYDPLNGSL